MLRQTLVVIGFACLMLGAWGASRGWPVPWSLFSIGWGLALTLGVIYERHRYKQLERAPPGTGWADTGERIVDEESGKLIAVYYNTASGERKYVEL